MKTGIKYFVFVLIIIGLTNCSSSNIFSLYSDEDINAYEMGREFVEKEDGIAFSALAFEEQADNNLVFQLYVANKDKEDILFDPSQIYMKAFDDNKKRIKLRNAKSRAIDPEIIIKNISRSEKERNNSHDVATGLNIVFSLFDTIVDLADDEDNDAEELAENILIFTGNQIGEEISYENDIEELKSQKEFWKNETLRLTVLSEDEEIQGLIFIPINRSAKYIKVFIPLGNTTHIYKFKQVSES